MYKTWYDPRAHRLSSITITNLKKLYKDKTPGEYQRKKNAQCTEGITSLGAR